VDLHAGQQEEEGGMTDNEAECLGELHANAMAHPDQIDTGFRPLDIGGTDCSHHAQTLIRMIPKGWVERRFFWLGGGTSWGEAKTVRMRGSCRYRITSAGLVALSNHQATVRVARSMAEARRAKLAARMDARKVTP
jgi:hypothetical protein